MAVSEQFQLFLETLTEQSWLENARAQQIYAKIMGTTDGSGEVETENADTSHCTVHQFAAKDDALERLGSEDQANFIVQQTHAKIKEITPIEYGHDEVVSEDADTSDCSVHQSADGAECHSEDSEVDAGVDADTSDYNVYQFPAEASALIMACICSSPGMRLLILWAVMTVRLVQFITRLPDPILSTQDSFRTHEEPPPKTFHWKRTKRLQKHDEDDNNADASKCDSKKPHTFIKEADMFDYSVHQLSAKNEAHELMAVTPSIMACISSLPWMRLVILWAVMTVRLIQLITKLKDPILSTQESQNTRRATTEYFPPEAQQAPTKIHQ